MIALKQKFKKRTIWIQVFITFFKYFLFLLVVLIVKKKGLIQIHIIYSDFDSLLLSMLFLKALHVYSNHRFNTLMNSSDAEVCQTVQQWAENAIVSKIRDWIFNYSLIQNLKKKIITKTCQGNLCIFFSCHQVSQYCLTHKRKWGFRSKAAVSTETCLICPSRRLIYYDTCPFYTNQECGFLRSAGYFQSCCITENSSHFRLCHSTLSLSSVVVMTSAALPSRLASDDFCLWLWLIRDGCPTYREPYFCLAVG